MKKRFVTILMLSFFLGVAHSQSEQPNIVVLLADDQGWGDLSWNGNSNVATPNIDRIGKEGASFANFYVQPVCSPTRAEFLTGRYASRSGVYSTSAGGERIDLDETTVARILKNAGYKTAAFGKWHSGMQYPYHPNARGFDEFYGFCSGHWGNYFSPMLEHNGEIVSGEGFLADDLTTKAIDFIENNREHPFFVYLPFNTPHSPMQVPEKFWKKYERESLNLKARDGDDEDEKFTKAALAMTENLDWNVGRVVKALKHLELEENTIVIYFSDNGPNSYRWNGNMKGRKGSTDEGGVRSPLLIKWPDKIKKGTQIAQISGAIDLLPTLLDVANIRHETEKRIDGISLKKQLISNQTLLEDRLIYNYWRGRLSVRNQQFRLDTNNQLFDMFKDREQTKDVSEQFPKLKEDLIQAKTKYIQNVVSELPEQDTRSFPLGHPDEKITQIPARDGIGQGNIKRSNRFPNCTFFTNWMELSDRIVWEVDVVASGDFEVEVYYTCPEGDEGAIVELSMGSSQIQTRIVEAFDPPLTGMENDRIVRMESYVKEFKPLSLGVIHLEKGPTQLQLKALSKPGKTVMDVRLLLFKRIVKN